MYKRLKSGLMTFCIVFTVLTLGQDLHKILTKKEEPMIHVFQHNYTGVQINVFRKTSEAQARHVFEASVVSPKDWMFLGTRESNSLKK